MQTVFGFEHNPNLSLALGFFDGVHQAHQVVISNAVYFAKATGIKSAVVTFKSHPIVSILNQKPQYITALDKRLELIERLGVDYVYVIDFDNKMKNIGALSYLNDYLVKYFAPKAITTGFNHSFGTNKSGSPSFLFQHQKEFGYKYFEIPPITYNQLIISSTKIRELLLNADFDIANSLLSENFSLESAVIKGNKLGRTIGFPTANAIYPSSILQIPYGIYHAKVQVGQNTYHAALNFGLRPTLTQDIEPLLEAHIFNFTEDIYGKKIKITPLEFIRSEMKFPSKDALSTQIQLDIQQITHLIHNS